MRFKFFKFPWLQKPNGAGQAIQPPAWIKMKIIVAPVPCHVSERIEIHPKWRWRRALPHGRVRSCQSSLSARVRSCQSPTFSEEGRRSTSLADTALTKLEARKGMQSMSCASRRPGWSAWAAGLGFSSLTYSNRWGSNTRAIPGWLLATKTKRNMPCTGPLSPSWELNLICSFDRPQHWYMNSARFQWWIGWSCFLMLTADVSNKHIPLPIFVLGDLFLFSALT